MLIGLQLFDGDAAANRRQRLAVAALSTLHGVEAVNLQFRDGAVCGDPALETVAVLEQDSSTVTRVAGRRKPLSREVFDRLAELAHARQHDHFGFINADILVTERVPAMVAAGGRQTYAISRGDVADAASIPPGDAVILTAGVDMFVVAQDWWRGHAHRFRPYIVGEMAWDVVYTATMLCHSDGWLLNREPLILHERHEAAWHQPTPSARYNGMLAALDAGYFSMWCEYWKRLEALRARGDSVEEEECLRRDAFVWRRSGLDAVTQIARSAKAQFNYRRMQRQWMAAMPPGTPVGGGP